jgi:hypothetical protein
MRARLPDPVDAAVRRYVRLADRLLPVRVVGVYVVGSVALGAYRRRRSDIDLIVVVDRRLGGGELRRLRAVQLASGAVTTPPALVRGDLALPGTVNATYVVEDDLTLPVSSIVPVAHHVGHTLHGGAGFDVNPVQWKTLADHGVAVRGPEPSRLGLDSEPGSLGDWNRENLRSYWQPLAERIAAGRVPLSYRYRPRWLTSWCVLGAPRLHATIATGDVISKEAAGEYALATFDARWHPIVREGLAYWREEPARPVADRLAETSGFVLEVVRSVA